MLWFGENQIYYYMGNPVKLGIYSRLNGGIQEAMSYPLAVQISLTGLVLCVSMMQLVTVSDERWVKEMCNLILLIPWQLVELLLPFRFLRWTTWLHSPFTCSTLYACWPKSTCSATSAVWPPRSRKIRCKQYSQAIGWMWI